MSAVSVRIVQSPAEADAHADATEELHFSSGNPRVERLTGVVHLYRPAGPALPASPEQHGSPLPATASLCVLGVPATMAVADFCQFCGAMLARVAEMKLVRSGGGEMRPGEASRYAVLLRFDAPASAVEFYRFYHGRAVCAGVRRAGGSTLGEGTHARLWPPPLSSTAWSRTWSATCSS
jgi:hypothetical protein